MENLITTLALFWVIYNFLFSEADKQLSEFLRRVRFALSVENGVINLQQLEAKQQLSVDEILEFAEQAGNNQMHNIALSFHKKYIDIEHGKNFIIGNLFLLTAITFVVVFVPTNFLETSLITFLNVYFLVSIILGIVFYNSVTKLPRVRFTKIIRQPQTNEA